MGRVLDFKRPHEALDSTPEGPNFYRQDGLIFGWSESNCQYELAWWFYTETDSPLVKILKKERPLPEGVTI